MLFERDMIEEFLAADTRDKRVEAVEGLIAQANGLSYDDQISDLKSQVETLTTIVARLIELCDLGGKELNYIVKGYEPTRDYDEEEN